MNSPFSLLLSTMLVITAAGCAESQPPQKNSRMNYPSPITTSNEAIRVSNDLTGLGRLAPSALATQIALSHCIVPFLATKLEGRPVWRVQYAGCRLLLPSADIGTQDKYQRTFTVVLDAKNGKLIQVEVLAESAAERPGPDITLTAREEQIATLSNTKLVDLPTEPPQVCFLKALDKIGDMDLLGSAYQAKSIEGLYVDYTKMDHTSTFEPLKAVWYIRFRGIPPVPQIGVPYGMTRLPVEKLNTTSFFIIDAVNGKRLSLSSP